MDLYYDILGHVTYFCHIFWCVLCDIKGSVYTTKQCGHKESIYITTMPSQINGEKVLEMYQREKCF